MKTALVLSGGGMFGAYQAGAWKAISREIAPDIVVGASIGALNGWYIAAGTPAEELERHWLDPASGDVMALRSLGSRWRSIFDPRPLERRVKLLMNSHATRIEYGVVLVRLPWLKPKLVRSGDVTWRHLVATCSIPGAYPPVRIGDGLYCDGGLLDPTPVWAAVEMGASRVIAVNSSRFIPPPGVGMVIGGMRFMGRRAAPSIAAEVVMITPRGPFGSLWDGKTWRRDNIRRWIDLGEADASAALEKLAPQSIA